MEEHQTLQQHLDQWRGEDELRGAVAETLRIIADACCAIAEVIALGPLAGKIWRIGQMGYASNPENILFCIDALGNVLNEFGYNTSVDKALEAARAVQAAL